MELSDQLHAPAALLPGETASGSHWLGGWVDPRAGLDAPASTKNRAPVTYSHTTG
jgi:hypothetical protein